MKKLSLWPIFLTEGSLAFVTTRFYTKSSDFCAYFLLLFLFLFQIVSLFNNLTEKTFTTFETEHNFCFPYIWFEGLRHRSLAETGRIFLPFICC